MKALNRNTRLVLWLVLACAGMGGLAYASVPLYRLFCQVTGFNGTTMLATESPDVSTGKFVRVRFDTNTNGIDWSFKPEKNNILMEVGKTAMVEFKVKNHADRAVTGRAMYNTVPESTGSYFMKLECFCFTDQTLQAGEEKSFPMLFYIDPEILKDEQTRNISDITLSYTFFETPEAKK